MVEPSLFDLLDNRVGTTRTTDPSTSFAAALDNMPRTSGQKQRIIRLLGEYSNGLTDYEIHEILGLHRGSASKRRGELSTVGLVQTNGQQRRTDTGSLADVHVLSEAGKRLLIHLNETSPV